MAFLPGNRQIFTVPGQCLGQGLAVGQGVEGAMKMSKAESKPAPGEESTGTLARLDLVSTLVLPFPLEHLCYFKLSVQQGKRRRGEREEDSFPFTNDSIKQISAAVRGEESGRKLFTGFPSTPPVEKGCIKPSSAGSWLFH